MRQSKKVGEIREKALRKAQWLLDNPKSNLSYSVIDGDEEIMQIGIVVMKIYESGNTPIISKVKGFRILEISLETTT